MTRLSLIALISLTAATLPVEAKIEVTIEPAIKIGEPFIGVHNGCEFSTDASVANVMDGEKLLTSIKYCAAYGYGHSSAEAFTDKTGRNYVLIQRDTVHASSYARYDLDIYRVLPGEDFKIMSIPIEIEAPDGPCPVQKYVHTIADSAEGGIELHLRREIECNGPPPKGVLLSPDLERVIRIDVPK